jgi:hypothetical protein
MAIMGGRGVAWTEENRDKGSIWKYPPSIFWSALKSLHYYLLVLLLVTEKSDSNFTTEEDRSNLDRVKGIK